MPMSMLIIGIAGGTGSGKTTVVNKIIARLKEKDITILSQDAYYRDNSDLPLEERQKINFDHPDALEFELLCENIRKLKRVRQSSNPSIPILPVPAHLRPQPLYPERQLSSREFFVYGPRSFVS